jgi:hypothetical protein
MPTAGGVAAQRPDAEAALAAVGRRLADMEITVFAPRVTTEALAHYADEGVARVVLALPSTTPDGTARALDDYQKVVEPLFTA